MKAMLLAAGRGTRLAPLTDSLPKILAPLGGRPLLEHQLDYLQASGVTELALNVHHHADQVRECIAGSSPRIPVRISHETRLLGTAGALPALRDFFDEPTVVLYGDVLTDANLEGLMDEHRRREPLATLAVYPSRDVEGKGVCVVERDGSISSFVEKPQVESGDALINAGLYVIEPRLLDLIEPGESDFGRDVWPAALRAGETLNASVVEGYVRDVGTPAMLEAASADLLAGALRW